MKNNLLFTSVLALVANGLVFSQNKMSSQNVFTQDQIASGANINSGKLTVYTGTTADYQQIRKSNPVIMACDTLGTTLAGGNGHDGNMFDVVMLNGKTISYFDGHVVGSGYMKIYYKMGTFVGSESNSAAWTLIDSAMVTSVGAGLPTYINIPINLYFAAGDTVAFYVTGTISGATVSYTNGITQGAIYSSNADMQIHEGIGVPYPFGVGFTPRVWNGIIHYCDSGTTPPPNVVFYSDENIICVGDSIAFTDSSAFNPTSWSWTFPGGNPSTDTVQNPIVTYTASGTYNVTLTATNASGSSTLTKNNFIVVLNNIGTPQITEDFKGAQFAPANFFLSDDGNDGIVWMRDSVTGAYGSDTASAIFDNFDFDVTGTRDRISTRLIDLSSAAAAVLVFDVAYSPYNTTNWSDTLAIYVSADCGITDTLIFLKGGTTLATNGTVSTSFYVPAANEWRNEIVDLSPFLGLSDVMISFENRGYFGNVMYIDLINITTAVGMNETHVASDIILFPNPVHQSAVISINNAELKDASKVSVKIYDIIGNEVKQLPVTSVSNGRMFVQFDRGNLESGMYFYSINYNNIVVGSSKFIIE